MFPGQYRPSDAQQRLYSQMRVSFYDSSSSDSQSPDVAEVVHIVDVATTSLTVTVTTNDASAINRVLVTYTDGQGQWNSFDLDAMDDDIWQGSVMFRGTLEYFIQVVDGAGNVTVEDNDGSYYIVAIPAVYLPLVVKDYEP